MLPQATLGAILCAVRIDFGLPSKINPYPAQPATGVLGQRPKRVLVPFTRVKGTPRRRAVQAATLWWLLPAAGDCKLAPAGQAYRLKPFEKPAPPQAPAIFFTNILRHPPPSPKIPPRFPRKSPRKGLTSGRHLCYDVITSRRRAFFSCAFLAFGPLLFPHGRAADHFSPQRGRQKKSEV